MIGIDLIKTSRMERFIERFGEKSLQKFLSEDEIKLVKNFKTASGFWATKEAFSKALGVGIGSECSFMDIKIYKDEKGAPKIAISKKIAQKHKIVSTALSITHDGEYAIAVVHLELESAAPDKVKQF
ncbi:MAG: holo-ACP synthase [Campylobacterales bacterium]|nr:holo-ACP synthase [Campylobacterales bacterium]